MLRFKCCIHRRVSENAETIFFSYAGGRTANEKLDRYYDIKSQGYNIEKVEKRVMEIFGVDKDVIYSKGRRKTQVAARSLLCYWAVRELGLTATELAKRFGMTQPAVSYAVSRRELIAKESNYLLAE